MAIYREKDVFERRNAASEAKKALLAKFNSRPSDDDPAVLARKAERKAILEARAIREAEKEKLKQERLAREAAERAKREAAAEEAARAEANQREAEETERIASLLTDEAERKAKRDARYAARKARVGRVPPGFTR